MLHIFNTLGRELQEFKPIEEGKIRFYQCGPTVYSRQHIGNLFSAVKGDFIRRSLMYLGYEVKFVRNITDVGHLVSDEDDGEDKMEKGAKKEGVSPEAIAKKYTDLYHQDIRLLNVLDPTVETIATEYVMQMAQMVQELLDKGFAYATELAIYFDVSKKQDYTKLSGQKLDLNKAGEGHGDISDTEKKNPFDFAVWFFKTGAHKNAIQVWDYQFKNIKQTEDKGFPGWHIECSAMAKTELGDTIDIHMGGREHIPTHHTNEIAQSESANGKTFSNYWIHHEWLMIDGVKISKSLGNGYTVDDIIAKGIDPLAHRYFLLQAHYRSKQNFTWDALQSAEVAYNKLLARVSDFKKTKSGKKENGKINEEYKQHFTQALQDDFNTSKALAVAWDMLKSDIDDEEKLATILDFDRVFGLSLANKSDEILKQALNQGQSYSPEVQLLIEERMKARLQKNWSKADEIRDRLKDEFGVEVTDSK